MAQCPAGHRRSRPRPLRTPGGVADMGWRQAQEGGPPVAIVRRGTVWQVQVRVGKDQRTGKWVRKAATRDTRAEAERVERQLLAEAEDQRRRWVSPTNESFASFGSAYIEQNTPRWRVRTRENYRWCWEKRLQPALGDLRLQDVSPLKVQALLTEMGGRRITQVARTLLRGILGEAERLGLVPLNAADRARVPHIPPSKRPGFSLEQGLAVLQVAQRRRVGNMLAIALYTGLRRGELCGLQWGDIDLNGRVLHVRRQVIQARQGAQVQGLPKTTAGMRNVPLVHQAAEALQRQKASLAGEGHGDSPWVFPRRVGDPGPVSPIYVTNTFQKIAKEAGFTGLPLHSLRHTTAALMLSAGIEPAQAAKALGHATLATFYSIYSDLLPQGTETVRQRLQQFLDEANARADSGAMSASASANRGRPPDTL